MSMDKVNFGLFAEMYSKNQSFSEKKCNISSLFMAKGEVNLNQADSKKSVQSKNNIMDSYYNCQKEKLQKKTNLIHFNQNVKKIINPLTSESKNCPIYNDRCNILDFHTEENNFNAIETVLIPRKEIRNEEKMVLHKKSGTYVSYDYKKKSFSNLNSSNNEGSISQSNRRRNRSISSKEKDISKNEYKTQYSNYDANFKNGPIQSILQRKSEFYHSSGC